MCKKILLLLLATLFLAADLSAQKIKDISNVIGVRSNKLIGYGLIVGLNGTGDSTSSTFTPQSIANMLESMNVKVDSADIKSKNTAAVVVTASLPSFARQGDKIDAVISSIGDAKSLQGGTLVMTPLKGVNGEVYALAQGPISIGGKNTGGGDNHELAGAIYGGAIVEKEVSYNLYNKPNATLSLKESNFQNAVEVQTKINDYFKNRVAIAIDPRTIKLQKPTDLSMIEFLAKVENIDINYDNIQKIVIDERTGTVVAGIDIEVDPIVISHKDITIKVDQSTNSANGVDLGDGVNLDPNTNRLSAQNPTVANIARALQKMGATPSDIIAILEAIKKAGAIAVDLEII